jgi:hypothetical protein
LLLHLLLPLPFFLVIPEGDLLFAFCLALALAVAVASRYPKASALGLSSGKEKKGL